MPIQTDLSVSPYFDDFDETKNFYKVLFRPGVAVQVRELNQLQTILQNQIERFGDNIFKSGTIISDCGIAFHDDLQYVKIKDIEVDSTPVVVSNYENYRIRNQNNLIPLDAAILKTQSGFESRTPDLNTLYIRYLNTGFANNGVTEDTYSTFLPDETLTVYNPENLIEKITVVNGSSGFSKEDRVVILSAIAIQNSTGGKAFANNFYSGDYITDMTANVQIIEAPDTTTLENAVILKIKPRAVDLKNGDSSKWTLGLNNSIVSVNATPSDSAKIVSIIGSGASALIDTTTLGAIESVNITSKGSGYSVVPSVSISSRLNDLSRISLFNATAQNYLTNITVASAGFSPVGNSYGMTVSSGVIYQKGYFSRVNEHLVIVEKYNNRPDKKVVGFETIEEIVSSNQDDSLLDNTTGEPNYTAPGANRLKLTPTLVTLTKSEADSRDEFLYIAEFAEGLPYKQNRQTVYNVIGNEMNRRAYETSGNYVLDPFMLNTKSPSSFASEKDSFNIVIDPGTAYINGSRVQTLFNYESPVQKGTNTVIGQSATISLNYGNYILVNQFGGTFMFKEGALISLYSTPGTYISSGGGDPSSSGLGTLLGTARIRSVVHDSGIFGTSSCIYRLYLFDIKMSIGNNFKNVKSVYYSDGTYSGIADTVLENGNAVLKDNGMSSMVFYAGQPAVKTVENTSYIYRTIDPTVTLDNTGQVTITSATGERFAYSGGLTTTQERSVIVTPLANANAATNLAGTIFTSDSLTVVNGVDTLFTSQLLAGDFIALQEGTVKQVSYIANNTQLFLTSTAGVTTATANNYKLYFPKNVPISFERSSRTITSDAPYTSLVADIGTALTAGVPASITYNVRSNPSAAPVLKTTNRNRYVRLCLANNAASNTGPWPIGVSDVFRLNKVYKGANGTFGAGVATGVTDVTQYFYVDHNQNEDYYGTSYLYPKPNSGFTLNASTDWLLFSIDHFTTSQEGIKIPGAGTYQIDDTKTLDQSTTTINTLEIPEMYGVQGKYYDLRDQFDFRPQSNNSVNPNTNVLFAPLNPTEPTVLFKTGDKKFPAPDSELTSTIEYYVGRTDRIVVDETSEFKVISGVPGSSDAPSEPAGAISINVLNIPPYPSIPFQLSANTIKFADTGIANEKYTTQRINNYRVTTTLDANDKLVLQPRNYTMEQISKLDRRISDLEYYTSVTLVEALTQKRNIASSYDPNVDRFKFGFYVDGFENYNYSDVTNPGYRASIVDGYLSPPVNELNINTDGSTNPTIPLIETRFISQNKATDGAVVVAPPTPPAPTQTIVSVVQSQRTTNRSDKPPYVFEDFYYTFSSTSGPVEFYLNARDNYVAMEVYQSKFPEGPWNTLTTSSQFAQAITTSDIAIKDLRSLNNFNTIEHPGTLDLKGYGPAGGFIEDQFKVLWTHNPEFGMYYRILIYKGKYDGGLFRGQGKKGTFGYKLFYPSDSQVNTVTKLPTTNYSLSFLGVMAPQFEYINIV